MRLFIDTSGWVALFDASDRFHPAARQHWQNFADAFTYLATSNVVVDKTLTYLLYYCGREPAVRFGEWIQNTQQIRLLDVDQEVWREAWEMFKAYSDKTWAFTDYTSFVLMRRTQIWRAFAFDTHFVQAGFQLWPGL